MAKFLSAKASDPVKLGWMQGFPPPPGKLLGAADDSFFEFPALRYSVSHMREFLPTVDVSRGLGAPSVLESAPDKTIDALTFRPGNAEPMTWETSLWENYTDGMLVLHQGKIVYERYFAELTEARVHAAMSVTKSLTGTLAATLLAEGSLDENETVAAYVPELKGPRSPTPPFGR